MLMRLWLSGYRSYELGIFNEQDLKVKVIKAALKERLVAKLDQGLEWVITGPNLGVEQWGLEVVLELKKAYPNLKLALLEPYADFSSRWQEAKQVKLAQLRSEVDFFGLVSKKPYQGIRQLQNYQNFCLNHSDQALFVYDELYPGKLKFAYQASKKKANYPCELVTMDELQTFAADYQENYGSW